MIHQLRIYEIFDHNKEAFHERFRDHASRIMKSYGFDIKAAWETRTGKGTEFVYLLAWPNEETMLDAWKRFRADEEWQRVRKETNARHGDLVGLIEERILVPTSYSPTTFANESSRKSPRKPLQKKSSSTRHRASRTSAKNRS